MSTIRKAFDTIKNIDPEAAGRIKVIDLVDGAIAVGPRGQYVQETGDAALIINGDVYAEDEDDVTDEYQRVAVAALLGYGPEAAI